MKLVPLTAAWAVGLCLGRWLTPMVRHGGPWLPVGLAALALGALLLVWWALPAAGAGRRWRLALTLVLLAGVSRFLLTAPGGRPDELTSYVGTPQLTLQGVVAAEPLPRGGYVELVVQARSIRLANGPRSVRGAALVRAPLSAPCGYGDLVEMHGRLAPLPLGANPSYADYLAARGIDSLFQAQRVQTLAPNAGSPWKALLLGWRRSAQAVIVRILPEPQAGLLAGILLGQRQALARPWMEAFNATGASHIVVISGWNISVLGVLLGRLFGLALRRRQAAMATLLSIWVYVALVGADPPVVRAGITGSLAVTALLLGRSALAMNSLAAAALAMTLWEPHLLWDASFQLSFAATVGLILFATPLEKGARSLLLRRLPRASAQRVAAALNEPLLVSLAAQAMVLPLLLHYFGRLSLAAPLANLLILPAQPPLLAWGAAATVGGLLWLPLGQVLGAGAWLFLTWSLGVAGALASLPYASLEVPPWGWGAVAAYYALGAMAWWWWRTPKPQRRRRLAAWGETVRSHRTGLAVVLPLGLALAVGFSQRPDGRLHVWFLDVGQGDAILIQGPAGRQVLVDGGPDPAVLLPALGQALPFWDRSLDVVALTHPDRDHVAGLVGLLDRYEVGQVLETRQPHTDAYADLWAQEVQASAVSVVVAHPGLTVDLGGGATAQTLHPPAHSAASTLWNDNNGSIVLQVRYGQVSFLLTGDMERLAEAELLRQRVDLQSTVLKVAHHGAASGTGPLFLQAVAPQLAVISVGAGNWFGHPADAVLERLAAAGVPVLRTDLHGTVEAITDGQRLWVHTARQSP
ncbi:MAG: ComEC/Rec2 family competence protein [Chloroflexi bacterium]|nr:ComEC/Rec2 family competence protein [Chloroflexota bacterium]